MSRKRTDAGFSIVEALVALAVFAMAGVGLVALQTNSISTLARVESRTLADIVAQNKLIETVAAAEAPDLGATEGVTELAGRAWRWRMLVAATPEPATRRVTVEVRPEGGGDGARAFGFVTVTGTAP